MPADPALPPHPPPVARLALAYDELPAGSDLRREYAADGAVTITAPAGDPSPALCRAMSRYNAVGAATLCAVVLAVALWAAWPLFVRFDAARRVVVMGLGVVLTGGVFLLAWKVWYGLDFDLVAKARREAAVLHADARGLLVETTGPGGPRSAEVAASESIRISIVGWRQESVSVPHLKLERPDGPTLRLLAGRDPAELKWVAATLSQALRRPEE